MAGDLFTYQNNYTLVPSITILLTTVLFSFYDHSKRMCKFKKIPMLKDHAKPKSQKKKKIIYLFRQVRPFRLQLTL